MIRWPYGRNDACPTTDPAPRRLHDLASTHRATASRNSEDGPPAPAFRPELADTSGCVTRVR